MADTKVISPERGFTNPHLSSPEEYKRLYEQSINDPVTFFQNAAKENLVWSRPFTTTFNNQFKNAKWFEDGELNIAYNCIDRHLEHHQDKTAFIWEGDDPAESKNISYQELHDQVCRLANFMKDLGVNKGDRVCIYLPMIPEAVYSMLACARIGAVHSVVFGGFSAESLKDRILDADCSLVITADQSVRGGKKTNLKKNVDTALDSCPGVKNCIVVQRTGEGIEMVAGRDHYYTEKIAQYDPTCECVATNSEDPLFILYTSGSTGKPKGVMHTVGGYLLGAHLSFKFIFGYQQDYIYWCTADVGWITGHTYIVYGPLSNCATSVIFEGVPTYPSSSRCWEICDKHQVNIFYTAPTAIRALMAQGDKPVKATSRKSLKLLGTVGEPINPEAWDWYYKIVGESRCQIIDTWWQTETGSVLISPIAGITPLKPGSATFPFFGVKPGLMNDEGNLIEGEGSGNLVIQNSWPSQIRTVYGDHQRMIDTYFSEYEDIYFTGDGAKRDKDGYYWITGRVDDVLNVSGHRLGTAEIESALVLHPVVAEAAVVGFEHPIKGQGIYAFVTLMVGQNSDDDLANELSKFVANEISPIAKPDLIQWSPSLPKTRSGKIMRRILRKIAAGETYDLGDTSTLAEPEVVKNLVENKLSLNQNSK
tara:strand:+ start:4242 stop:6188 length:1947 start_codon:yes stop_codon:yes gene_type:complete